MASPKLPKPWKASLMELFLVGLVALVVGFFLGFKLIAKAAQPEIKEMQKNQAIDRASYLFTLRRELANILIWRDPQRYVKLYKELCSEFNSFKSWRLEEINKRLSELSKEYPFYADFDTIGSKEYVLYPDAVSWNSYEKLEANYRDLATFVALSLQSNASWQDAKYQIDFNFTAEHVPDKLEHLLEYVERIEDTKLIMRIDQAMDAYYTMRDKETGMLDNDLFAVKMIYRSRPDNLYGIHIKRTNEFAIYSVFHYDGGGTSTSHYRSDSTFEKEDLLFSNPALLDELRRPL
jgi:hypothetical protein